MYLLVGVIGYLIGCFSSAYVVGKMTNHIDIREHGSGNSGTTNALRVMGKKAAVITFLCDVLKGVIAALIGRYILGDIGQVIGGLCAVIGHNWPMFLSFKGGKGVATSLGVLITINPLIVLTCVIIGLIIALVTNYVSVGSLSFLGSFPIIYYIKNYKQIEDVKSYFLLSVVFFLLGVIRHKENIKRLINKTENKFRK